MILKTKTRCAWVGTDPLEIGYHDMEWGNPVFNDIALFEMLTLEGAQAGLSWLTILKKRDAYREAFDYFDIDIVAKYDEEKIRSLMQNEGIVRNEAKIRSTIKNAQLIRSLRKEFRCFSEYLWNYTGGFQIQNAWEHSNQVPAITALSDTISADMSNRGFSFFGPAICYAFMQAIGMVNDHTTDCFRYHEIRNTKNKTW